MIPRRLLYALVLGGGLLCAPLSAAQAPSESAISRARIAVALRDSVLKINGEMKAGLQAAGIGEPLLTPLSTFLKDPFDPEVEQAPTLDQLDLALAGVNRYLKQPTAGRDGSRAPDGGAERAGVGDIAADVVGNLGLPTEAQLIVGLTDFMVDRAKDEVAFSFVLNLRNEVQGDRWLRLGLPRSHRLMQSIDTETYQVFFPVLRSAFLEDLNEMPARANALADSLGGGRSTSTYIHGLAIAYRRGLEIRRGSPPAVALANLLSVDSMQMPDSIARRALQMVGLIAREYSAGGGEPFVQEVTRPDRGWLRRYLVGFLTHDVLLVDRITDDGVKESVFRFIGSRESDAILLVNQLHAMRDVLMDVREQVAKIDKEADDAGEAYDRTLAAAGAVLQVMNTGQRFLNWGSGPEPQQARDFRQFVADATTLHQAFMKRDYGSLVTWVVQRPELRLCGPEAPAGGLPADFIAAVRGDLRRERKIPSRSAGADAEAQARADSRIVEDEARQRFAEQSRSECATRMKYLSFAASLASARTSEEVTTALRAASAPVGSYRAKRNQYVPREGEARPPFFSVDQWQPKSVSVGGYLGVTGGLEGDNGFPTDADAAHFGVALPVGIELSTGFPLGALSLFAPVLDLGTLASVRLGDGDTNEGDPTLRQVLAPGLFGVWNFSRGIPLSLGIGAQVVPELRERNGESVDVVRASVFLGVDATLFHFRL